MVKHVNDREFKEEISEGLVVVDFWAPWCGPCKMVGPVIEEMSKELEGKVKFVKVNVDENPMSSSQYNVTSIPTIITFKNGKMVDNVVGFKPKATLKSVIERHI